MSRGYPWSGRGGHGGRGPECVGGGHPISGGSGNRRPLHLSVSHGSRAMLLLHDVMPKVSAGSCLAPGIVDGPSA